MSERKIISMARRIYSGMLCVYPRAHLRQYRDQMQQVFADMTRDALRTRGAIGVITVLVEACADTGSNALAEHAAERSVYMGMLKEWAARRLNTEKFDPVWGSFFVGMLCSLQVVAGLLLIEFSNDAFTPAAHSEIMQWMGILFMVSVVPGVGVHVLQLRAYNKRMRALGHPVSEFRLR